MSTFQQRYLETFPPLSLNVATQRCVNVRVTFLDYVFTTFTQCCGNVATTLNC